MRELIGSLQKIKVLAYLGYNCFSILKNKFILLAVIVSDIYTVTYIQTCVSDIYAKISVYEIKIGTLNAPLIFHQQIMVVNDSQEELLTTITQILVILVILDVHVKYVIFHKCVHYISAKIIIVSSASIFDHYIFCPSVMLGTTCTAYFSQTINCIILRRENLPCKPKMAPIYAFVTSML